MYQRILVPLDGSQMAEQVLGWVEVLATGMGSRIELLRVIEPVPSEISRILPEANLVDVAAALSAQAEEYLEAIAAPFRNNGREVSTTIVEGSPDSCIPRQAEQEANTLLAMTTHGRSGLQRWYMGSVSDKVLHATSCPLLLVRAFDEENPPGTVRFETLIVPLDGSPLAEQALPHARALAQSLNLRVLLVTATSGGGARREIEPDPQVDGGPTPSTILKEEEYCHEDDAPAFDYLHQIKAEFEVLRVPGVDLRLLKTPATEAIVDLAQETPNALTVMASHGRTGLGRWILGSVTDRVVRQSRSLVLVVRAREGAGP